jgi:cytochrome oxidase Cu insertion factor (SCO1/SenC/PrrC family)
MARKRSSVKARKKALEKEKQWQQWQRRIVIAVIGLLALFAAVFVFARGQSDSDSQVAGGGLRTAPEVGALAPEIELTSKDGELLRLSDYRGRPVAVNFMHTW